MASGSKKDASELFKVAERDGPVGQTQKTREMRGVRKSRIALLKPFTLWLFNIAMENGRFIVDLPSKDDDFS